MHACPPALRVSTVSTPNTPNPASPWAAFVGATGSRLGFTACGSVLPTPQLRVHTHADTKGRAAPPVSTVPTPDTPNPAGLWEAMVEAAGSRLGMTAGSSVCSSRGLCCAAPRVSTVPTPDTPNPAGPWEAMVEAAGSRLGMTARSSVCSNCGLCCTHSD